MHDDALAREGGVAVDEHRHHFLARHADAPTVGAGLKEKILCRTIVAGRYTAIMAERQQDETVTQK